MRFNEDYEHVTSGRNASPIKGAPSLRSVGSTMERDRYKENIKQREYLRSLAKMQPIRKQVFSSQEHIATRDDAMSKKTACSLISELQGKNSQKQLSQRSVSR